MSNLWENLGIWDAANTFEEAAETLAFSLGELAALKPEHSLLSVGFGGGAEIMLWRNDFGVEQIIGVEPEPGKVEMAKSLCRDLPEVHLICGSAGDLRDALLNTPPRVFDRVLAVDCAYHFRKRKTFFRDAYTLLKPGGVLALSDLIFPSPGRDLSRVSWLSSVFDIPQENMVPLRSYLYELEEVGFGNFKVIYKTVSVLGGFSRNWLRVYRYLRRQNRPNRSQFLRVAMTATAAKVALWRGAVEYALISANKARD